jgi:hypothetical protein
VVESIGVEVLEIADGKIKVIRDYHKRVSAAVSDRVQAEEDLR